MSDLVLNLNELNIRHEQSEINRKRLFDDIVKKCHNKIKKYNIEFKKQECLYSPPPFVIGKPPYNFIDLVTYVRDSLIKNGLKVQWLPDKSALYISWKPCDINLGQYHNHYSNTMCADNYDDQVAVMTIQPRLPAKPSNQVSGKKKKGPEKPILQHVAMLEYNNAAKDLIPINIKGLK